MGWFRKVMDYVLGYEVKEIIVKDGKEIEKIKKEPVHKKKEPVMQHPLVEEPKKEKGEVQARVAYQYPQGKFRFPLIPDEELVQEPRPRRRKEADTAENHVLRKQPYRNNPLREKEQAEYPQRGGVKQAKEEQTRTRPFRPTEVPSPIYGFKQRSTLRPGEAVDKAIEIELPSSSVSMLQSSKISYNNLSAEREIAAYKEVADRYDKLISPLRPKYKSHNNAARSEGEDSGKSAGPIPGNVRFKDTKLDVRENPRQGADYGSLYEQTFRFKPMSEESLAQNTSMTREKQGSGHHPVAMHSPQAEQTQNRVYSGGQLFLKREELPEQRMEEKQMMQGTLRAETERTVEPAQPVMESTPYVETERTVGPEQSAEARQVVQPAPYIEIEKAIVSEQPQEAQPVMESTPYVETERMVEPEQRMEGAQFIQLQQPVEAEPAMARQEQVDIVADRLEVREAAEGIGRMERTDQSLQPAPSADSKQPVQQDRPRRPFVPFNVMMLKKDRQQLEKRELVRKSAQSAQTMSISGQANQHAKEEREQKESNNVPFSKTEHAVQRTLVKDKASLQAESPSSPLLSGHREGAYEFPSMNLLSIPKHEHEDDHQWLEEQRQLLDMTLKNFNVRAKVVNMTQGPTVTRFEVHPEPGVKVNKITNLTDDIKLSLAARDIRIEAPIPGKNTIGIEVPNRQSKAVLIQEILSTPVFKEHSSPLAVALGLDISGTPIVIDLKKMPHGLIAGATGSGKSVCINTIIVSLLYKASPHQVKLMLIDPKMVELAPYNGIPHLVSPVITDAKAATAALKWAVEEMERRYELFAHTGVRDITKYNEKVKQHNEKSGELPYLVIIIDELADLMMVSPGEVEEAICRIAQKARACGIHLLLATQRPSVDVITGLIKANVPTRVAFSVSSQVDSRTIIDTAGAEKLLGRGDMLLLENGSSKTVRVQGNFVSDEEIDAVVDHVKKQMKPNYLFEQNDLIQKQQNFSSEEDELFYEACEFVLNQGGASTSSLQRHFRIGYNRAARLIDMMEGQGIISEAKGSRPRDILITEDELTELQNASSSF
ncbi:DNA translocase FtsK [Bacillus songklensis]|uniref:DNA translocase FtsK n=1 Tax=Bacillus songklensis TaxID=1069116 RepID=A0ABV8B0W1_9BACI